MASVGYYALTFIILVMCVDNISKFINELKKGPINENQEILEILKEIKC